MRKLLQLFAACYFMVGTASIAFGAAAIANSPVSLRNGTPTSDDFSGPGGVALDVTSGAMYYKNGSGAVQTVTPSGVGAITGGTIVGAQVSNSTLAANNALVTETNVAAAGSAQSTGTALSATASVHKITSAATGEGVVLPACVDGVSHTVLNGGAGTLLIYGNSSSDTINGGTYSIGVPLASGQGLTFTCVGADARTATNLAADQTLWWESSGITNAANTDYLFSTAYTVAAGRVSNNGDRLMIEAEAVLATGAAGETKRLQCNLGYTASSVSAFTGGALLASATTVAGPFTLRMRGVFVRTSSTAVSYYYELYSLNDATGTIGVVGVATAAASITWANAQNFKCAIANSTGTTASAITLNRVRMTYSPNRP